MRSRPWVRFDAEAAAVELGINVTYWNMRQVFGVYARVTANSGEIALRVDLQDPVNESIRRVVLAHEIGHHVLHHGDLTTVFHCGGDRVVMSRAELSADRWAGQIICPAHFVREVLSQRGSIGRDEIVEIAECVGAPVSFIVWWLADLRRRGVVQDGLSQEDRDWAPYRPTVRFGHRP
jgi:hypothetical protein